jgi:hypothetical protein
MGYQETARTATNLSKLWPYKTTVNAAMSSMATLNFCTWYLQLVHGRELDISSDKVRFYLNAHVNNG